VPTYRCTSVTGINFTNPTHPSYPTNPLTLLTLLILPKLITLLPLTIPITFQGVDMGLTVLVLASVAERRRELEAEKQQRTVKLQTLAR
jgi:hypothetical protein